MKPTPCETCEHVHPSTIKMTPSKWMCMKFKRIEGWSVIAPTVWEQREPYMRCMNINGGDCPLWEARKGKSDDV